MPGLNPLVDKIRAQYPGVYDDLDDATLTKSVLAKYPQYSDLAAPSPLQSAAKPNVQMQEQTPYLASMAAQNTGTGELPSPKGQMAQQTKPSAAVGALTVGGAGALGVGSIPGALPFLQRTAGAAVKAAPYVAASEAINYARQRLPLGKYIPPGAELLPFFMGGGERGKAAGEKETVPPASTDQMPGRPYQPNPRYQPQPQPEPLPQRTGPLLLKGEVQQPPAPTNYKKLPWMPELEKSLGNQPGEIKPGVPMRQQQIAQPAKQSSVIEGYNYDPQAREFHVQTKSGGGYIYGDVSPEDAQAFDSAESKGKAWQQIKSNPLVGKIVNGQRVNVKPTAPSQASPTPTSKPTAPEPIAEQPASPPQTKSALTPFEADKLRFSKPHTEWSDQDWRDQAAKFTSNKKEQNSLISTWKQNTARQAAKDQYFKNREGLDETGIRTVDMFVNRGDIAESDIPGIAQRANELRKGGEFSPLGRALGEAMEAKTKSQGNDLTDILTQSLKQVRGNK